MRDVNRIGLTKVALGVAISMTLYSSANAKPEQSSLTPEETYALARDAYFFAYPIVSMDITMRQTTNVPDNVSVNLRAPLNQFAHARAYPNAEEKDVRFNFDTLRSHAWVDVSREPVLLSVPDTEGRYYLLPMLDMWTDVFAVVGSRTTGTKAATFALVAPGWRGSLPDGVTRIVARTTTMWISGRTQTNGPSDYANVHKVQDGFKLTPLSQWGKAYTPPKNTTIDPSVDNQTPPQVQVSNLDGITMLSRLADLMTKYPPHANDYPILFRLRALGVELGRPFDATKLDPQTVSIINKAAKDALQYMTAKMRTEVTPVNGWNTGLDNIGTYGTSYRRRAIIALGGLGANLPEDAVYPTAFVDSEGKPLTGANHYVLHFEKGKLPPVGAFWSVTMYDQNGFRIPNAINRYALGDRDKLKYNEDGSLDFYLQAESPGEDKEANWLPAPPGAFQPTMRLYSPRPEVLDGSWTPPPITRAN